MKMLCRIILALLCSLGAAVSIAQAQELHDPNHPEVRNEIPLARLAAKAAAVVEGRVAGQRSFWNSDHTRIYTAHTVQVYKVFKGTITGTTVEVLTRGGHIGGVGQELPGANPPLQERAAGILFLVPATQESMGSPLPRNQQFQGLYGPYGAILYESDARETTAVSYLRRYHNIPQSLYAFLSDQTRQPYREVAYFDVNQFDQWAEKVNNRVLDHSPAKAGESAKNKRKYKRKL